jgi:(S)-ureidoglycine aminohydrolase
MSYTNYHVPQGGLPPQSERLADRAIFTESFAFIPSDVQTDIVTSFLPHWQATRLWVLARPMTGFAETFSHYLMEVGAGGGSQKPEDDLSAQSVLFVVGGQAKLTYGDSEADLQSGSYAYLPTGLKWKLENRHQDPCHFHWIRKRYQPVEGIDAPDAFVTTDSDTPTIEMPGTDGIWATTRFVMPDDLRHDMHVNIVTFQPGGRIPFAETHVMEHGLYVLQGSGVYYLNGHWIEVSEGDYMWLRAFCPQACYAAGTKPFRYLLYKDVNRHMPLTPLGLKK